LSSIPSPVIHSTVAVVKKVAEQRLARHRVVADGA